MNTVAPGPIASAMTSNLPGTLRALIPVGRMGEGWEVAEAIAFLASDAAGEQFHVIGLAGLAPRCELRCRIRRADGTVHETVLRCRIDSRAELGWYGASEILPFVAYQLRDAGRTA